MNELIKFISVSGAITAGVVWLLQSFISKYFEYNSKIFEHRSKTKFDFLYNKRAGIILQIYINILEFEKIINSLIATINLGEDELEDFEKIDDALEYFESTLVKVIDCNRFVFTKFIKEEIENDFDIVEEGSLQTENLLQTVYDQRNFYKENKLFFSNKLCEKIEAIYGEHGVGAIALSMASSGTSIVLGLLAVLEYFGLGSKKKDSGASKTALDQMDLLKKRTTVIEEKFNEVKTALEDEFRSLLGVD